MKAVDVYNQEGKKVRAHKLGKDVSKLDVHEHLFHDVVRYQLARKRQGSANTKTRSDVRGGGAKPFRQKGLGRARVGTRRSPLHVGGGVIFGPHPRDFSFKLPKKVRRKALVSAVVHHFKQDSVKVLEPFAMTKPHTKTFCKLLDALDVSGKVLLVVDTDAPVLYKSVRNIPRVTILRYRGLNVFDLLNADHLLVTESVLERMEKELLI